MFNSFKHSGRVELGGVSYPYAFGPNQAAILCNLRGWEFWQHEQLVMPALYALSRYAALSSASPPADPEELRQAGEEMLQSLFNDPTFIQDFYFSALSFGATLSREEFIYTPGEVGMAWSENNAAFLPLLTHYAKIQQDRMEAAESRPTPARRAGETKKKPTKAR